MLAGAAGGFSSMLYHWARYGKPDPSMICNGSLAGLVAITAPSAFVHPTAAVLIGLIAGILVVESVFFVDRKLRVDDPVGAVSVHFLNGLWGVVAVGLFADGTYGDGLNGVSGAVTGLFYGGGFGQLAAQLVAVGVAIIWGFGVSYLFYRAYHAVFGLRSKPEDELAGLDLPEMGVFGYPEFSLSSDGPAGAARPRSLSAAFPATVSAPATTEQ
jgi:Amt family ammonium transporter